MIGSVFSRREKLRFQMKAILIDLEKRTKVLRFKNPKFLKMGSFYKVVIFGGH